MTCPRCGTLQAETSSRCSRCRGSLVRPAPKDAPVTVVGAPTRRGALAQRAAGVVVTAPPIKPSAPRPQQADPYPGRTTPAYPSGPAGDALGAPVASPDQYGPPTGRAYPGRHPTPAPATVGGAFDAPATDPRVTDGRATDSRVTAPNGRPTPAGAPPPGPDDPGWPPPPRPWPEPGGWGQQGPQVSGPAPPAGWAPPPSWAHPTATTPAWSAPPSGAASPPPGAASLPPVPRAEHGPVETAEGVGADVDRSKVRGAPGRWAKDRGEDAPRAWPSPRWDGVEE